MSNEELADLTQPQRDRLAFVELRVRFIGEIRRQDLVSRFGIQSAAATRDLALYKEIAPGNIDYDAKGKAYVLGADFRPVFDFPPERILSWLTQGFGDGEPMRIKAWVASERDRLRLEIERGNQITRERFEDAVFGVVKVMVRGLVTLGDRLERDKRVKGDVLEYLENAIGELRDELAAAVEAMKSRTPDGT